MLCAGARPPGVRPSWTMPRSSRCGPRWNRAPDAWFRGRSVDPGTGRPVVERVTGVVLSRASVWRLLTGRLGWSLQRPERRAVERDEPEIGRWVAHEWPRIKKGP
ncbi:winged helix-turn-helix domain-containing protein [Streptomyces sp. NPDC053431]|uniref:winged helix-turn-helix domain-containing protein n=1 Tax=Streptomyces sp. NPDC053431 TaxID=3365703 RepID=UPI0037D94C7D